MAEPQIPLFTAKDLADWLHRSVTPEGSAVAEKVVWGWLQPLLKPATEVRPDPVPDKLFSWALELGGIAYVNPEGLSQYQLEDETTIYGSERRDEILALAASGGTVTDGAAPSPIGSFPPAPPDCYPAGYGYFG